MILGFIRRRLRELRKPPLPSQASFQRALDVRARETLAMANAARDSDRPEEAADLYRAYCRLRPERADVQIQLGNMLLEVGRHAEAALAYRAALDIAPSRDGWLQLGRALQALDLAEQSVAALLEALKIDSNDAEVRRALTAAGAGPLIAADGSISAQAFETWRLQGRVTALQARLAETSAGETYALKDYDLFRRTLKLPTPPPSSGSELDVLWLVDAFDAPAYALRETLDCLTRLPAARGHKIHVVASDALLAHPVASAAFDPRISLAGPAEAPPRPAQHLVSLSAGCVVDPNAAGWLASALTDRLELVFADHDHSSVDQSGDIAYLDPVFWPCADPLDMATAPQAPPVIMARGDPALSVLAAVAGGQPGAEVRRNAAVECIRRGAGANLPLLLSSLRITPQGADRAADPPRSKPSGASRVAPADIIDARSRIRIVIPTRDQGLLVETAVRSLMETAAAPQRLAVVVVDNGSTAEETRAALGRVSSAGIAVERIDEPFNWSRLNNLAVAGAQEDILLFVNDDTQMLTPHWDRRLTETLADERIAIAGARLLYPDETVQHAGVMLGFGATEVLHEGLGCPRAMGGPSGRWRRPRGAAAVTGAFMAVRRSAFEALGGFNATDFAIGYSDIDLCLRARDMGWLVAYLGDVEALHFESKTRGFNNTVERAAFDQVELVSFRRLWGAGASDDPSLNPHLVRQGPSLDRVRAVTFEAAMDHIDRVNSASPWKPRR